MTKDEIEIKAAEYGFDLWAIINGGKQLQFMDDRGINLIVDMSDLTYEFIWKIPRTLFKICSEKCSPFGSKHFQHNLIHFRTEVTLRDLEGE